MSPTASEVWAEALTFELPWPPSINTYWRPFMAKGRLINSLSSQGRRFRKDVKSIVPPMRMDGQMAVSINLTMPDRRKRDIDNVVKPILDALEHAELFTNDNLVRKLTVEDVGIEKPGGVLVTIIPWSSGNGS